MGRRLAWARESAGCSQEDVAKEIGVTTARYRTLEEGAWTEATRGLRLDTIVLLCRFLDVPPGDLIPGR
ncbi:helix-turn-helix transcriptional regulator [Aeromicrobium sp. YIM 150415]|uniref:helix-turn-helix transcriptional regulator n=1 Tax=Aeromicrobium sp. YIM 150415 TaxID=2803912 RepID=UPI0019668E65|nr:helix-turn-helix transcriptional regulator [Aeromicrobium sp. YIM 150415]MBM9463531.1 helix-turn-helix transcriptional regulator [Aeromicrobium sp. YIM 150415]